ncbi:CBS domain-containing protein [Granulicella rosea]|uniref:CBS domain-containing protein n=1 Tax=Granulicella rosea TaxID=474952 RepID=A0A239EVG4_9BACT|nr:CBS domain-containing protein [Granulicella rosea]SNS48577.1 CBS domain-containing protein [Granulicella rosea]
MSKLGNQRTSVSALMGVAVADSAGRLAGHVCEFAVLPEAAGSQVEALVLKPATAVVAGGEKVKRTIIRVCALRWNDAGGLQTQADQAPIPLPADENYLMLERDLLDQQIIDVHGHKVVRVNDVDLVWERQPDESLQLRIAEVEVGLRGAARRLLKGLPVSAVDRLACRIRPSVIPWDFVDLIDRDPARRVRLKIEQDKLSKMHPSDLADILEELAPAEREALFSSLDEEVAAEALEEVQPKMQKTLIEGLDSERIAGILEEMDPGAAADLLSELSDERSDAILEEMDPKERQEVEDLLDYSPDSAAGLMTNEYVSLPPEATVADAHTVLQAFEGDLDSLTDLFLVDEARHLRGQVPLVKLVLAAPEKGLGEIADEHMHSIGLDANGRKVAELFDKYNLRCLPVLADDGRLAGVVHADQVIAWLRTR